MVKENLEFLRQFDPEVADAIGLELSRQRRNIELIASENIVSEAVMSAMGSVLTNKYAEGYPGKRYYGGCECVDVAEEIARIRDCSLDDIINITTINAEEFFGIQMKKERLDKIQEVLEENQKIWTYQIDQ